jgi:CSLREA domain-containing protein
VTYKNRAVRKGRAHLVIAALAAALLVLAAVPAFAAAAGIEVNSLGDAPQLTPGPTCDTGAPAGEQCTLRAAIEAADFDPDTSRIEFLNPPFEGGQQIALGSTLPPITHPVTITAQSHVFSGYNAPNVGVTTAFGQVGLRVQSSGVVVENIAFGGGKVGIEVGAGAKGFTAEGDWFGLDVTGATATIQGPGIVLGPGADEANIGGIDKADRNVFTHATYGIYIEGASRAEILGNYIGVGPAGGTGFGGGAAGISNGVRVVDTSTSTAKGNVIGGIRTSPTGTTDCGGACNVIVASGLGIDLHGEVSKSLGSPTGPTTIRGNYIGLAADGSAISVPSAFAGIYAERPTGTTGTPGPGQVTVGGATAAEGNVIDNGLFGMIAEGAEGLLVQRNLFGWLPASAGEGSGPEGAALVVIGEGLTDRPEALENEMHLGPNAVGIESYGPGSRIVGNKIFGSETGLVTGGEDAGSGNTIAGNLIEGPDLYGVLLQNDANAVTGNSIVGVGRSGVQLDREEAPEPWPTANRIGGDSPSLENLVEGSGESAISVGGEPETTNEVLGNFGLGNGGPFIELREHSAGHPPNGEIKPPTLAVAYESSASGTAIPGAKVRVFGKPSTDPGSLERQIGSAIADASGHWTATFATKVAVGKLVAATQTSAPGTPSGATSEVSAPAAAVADPIPPEEPKGGGGGNGGGSSGNGSGTSGPPPPPAVAKVAPKVKIISGPKKTTTATKVTFKFKATNVSGAKFECKLDGARWASCKSPKTLKKLKVGKHTFRVRAKANGITGGASKYQFTITS